MTEDQALAANKKGHQSPPIETADGLRIVINEREDGGLEVELDWEEGSPWQYLADLTAEEVTEIVVTELTRFVQEDEEAAELSGE
jgi:hypothetical protein